MTVPIYDVAAHAGVSIKTVSRVMNAEPNVREETRDRVRGSAAALSYHPNLSARSLVALVSDFSVRRCSAEHWSIGAASAAPTTRRASSSGPPGPAARPAIISWSSCWTTTRPACNTK